MKTTQPKQWRAVNPGAAKNNTSGPRTMPRKVSRSNRIVSTKR